MKTKKRKQKADLQRVHIASRAARRLSRCGVSTQKRKPVVFKFLQLEEHFREKKNFRFRAELVTITVNDI